MISLEPLKLSEFLSLLISIVGFIAVLWSLKIYMVQANEMAQQNRYLSESLRKSIFQSIESYKLAIAQTFIQEPQLRIFFYGRQDITPDDQSYLKAVAVAELILHFFDSVVNLGDYLSIWPSTGLYAYMKESFADSPILCTCLQTMRNRLTAYDEVAELMEEGQQLRLTCPPSQSTLLRGNTTTKVIRC